MIRVRVELLSAVTGATTELARMEIFNDGEASAANPKVGDYGCRTLRGRSAAELAKGVVQRKGAVKGWRRYDFHVWNLVALALLRMGYTQGHPRTDPAIDAEGDRHRDLGRLMDATGVHNDGVSSPATLFERCLQAIGGSHG